MTRSAAILLLALTGCRGCEDGAAEPLATGPAAEDIEADAAPRPRPLLPEDLDGVFPPRWGLGDEWFVRTRGLYNDQFRGEIYLIEVFHFRVVDVPREGHEYYLVEAEGGPRQMREHTFLVFRPPDYSEIYSPGSMIPADQIPSFPHHLSRGGRVFTFPTAPPFLSSNPPRFANPINEEIRSEEGSLLRATVQTMEPTVAGLRVTIELTELFYVERIVLEWRRGDPWWSSLRSLTRGRDEDDPTHVDAEVLRDVADLLRPGEPLLPE